MCDMMVVLGPDWFWRAAIPFLLAASDQAAAAIFLGSG